MHAPKAQRLFKTFVSFVTSKSGHHRGCLKQIYCPMGMDVLEAVS